MVHLKHRTRGAAKIQMKGEPRFRSTSLNQVRKRTPGGRTVVHYEKPSPGKAMCGVCRYPLHGLLRGTIARVKRFSRSDITIQRPFGANLCSSCSRAVQKWRARVKFKLSRDDEVPISLRNYVMTGAKQ